MIQIKVAVSRHFGTDWDIGGYDPLFEYDAWEEFRESLKSKSLFDWVSSLEVLEFAEALRIGFVREEL